MKAACAALALALALALPLAGCGGLSHQAAPTVWLALEPARQDGGLRPLGPSVEVGRFATAAPFASDRLATRDASGTWSFASYHRWAAQPGVMVSSRLRDALSCADLFGAVFTPPAPLEPDYRITGAVRALYWDRAARAAVLEIEASLVAPPDRLAGFWVHRVSAPVEGRPSAASFVAAGSAAQATAFERLRADLARALAADAVPPSGGR